MEHRPLELGAGLELLPLLPFPSPLFCFQIKRSLRRSLLRRPGLSNKLRHSTPYSLYRIVAARFFPRVHLDLEMERERS